MPRSARARFPTMAAWLAVAGVIAGVVAMHVYYRGGWQLRFLSRRLYPVQGIDVSHHQGEIDWRAVHKDGVMFAYIKATEGGDFVDTRFRQNWRAAADAGLRRGAYHFFSLCREPELQAQNFLAVVPPETKALPPAIDLEFGGNCSARPAAERVCEAVRHFTERVEATLHKRLLVYATDEFLSAYRACIPDRPLWVRAVLSPTAPRRRSMQLWQFANRGRVQGIVGPVDLDAFCGDRVAFDLF